MGVAAELGGAVRRRHVEAHFEEGRRVAPRAAAEVEDGGSRCEQRSEALPHGGELNVARRVCKLVGMRRAVGEGLVGRCRHGGPLTQAVRLGVYPIAKRAFSARTVLRRTHDSGALGQANTPDNAFRSRVRLYAGVWCGNRSIPGSKSHRTPPSSSVSALLADIWCAEGSRALHGCESRPPLCVSKSRADPALSASRGAVMLVAEAAGGRLGPHDIKVFLIIAAAIDIMTIRATIIRSRWFALIGGGLLVLGIAVICIICWEPGVFDMVRHLPQGSGHMDECLTEYATTRIGLTGHMRTWSDALVPKGFARRGREGSDAISESLEVCCMLGQKRYVKFM